MSNQQPDEERKKRLLEYFEVIKKANREGYAGCKPTGELVDRRSDPDSYPVAENSMFNIKTPRMLPNEPHPEYYPTSRTRNTSLI